MDKTARVNSKRTRFPMLLTFHILPDTLHQYCFRTTLYSPASHKSSRNKSTLCTTTHRNCDSSLPSPSASVLASASRSLARKSSSTGITTSAAKFFGWLMEKTARVDSKRRNIDSISCFFFGYDDALSRIRRSKSFYVSQSSRRCVILKKYNYVLKSDSLLIRVRRRAESDEAIQVPLHFTKLERVRYRNCENTISSGVVLRSHLQWLPPDKLYFLTSRDRSVARGMFASTASVCHSRTQMMVLTDAIVNIL